MGIASPNPCLRDFYLLARRSSVRAALTDPGNSHSRASAPCDFRRSACLLPPLAGQASVPPDCHSLLPQFGESEPSDSLLRFAAALRNCVFGRSKAPPLQISCFKLCKYRSFPATPKHSGELCSPACTGNRAWLLPLPNTSSAFGRGMGFQREIGGNPNSPCSLWAQRSAHCVADTIMNSYKKDCHSTALFSFPYSIDTHPSLKLRYAVSPTLYTLRPTGQ